MQKNSEPKLTKKQIIASITAASLKSRAENKQGIILIKPLFIFISLIFDNINYIILFIISVIMFNLFLIIAYYLIVYN